MEKRTEHIRLFFDQYADRFNLALKTGDTDIDATVTSFADCFVEASPVGVTCGKNDEQFRQVIPLGYGFYKSIGITAMNILDREVVILDDHHAMARIHWRSVYDRKDGKAGHIDFDVIYFVQDIGKGLKIFAYITGDEQKALKDNGLI
ncbi:MAG: hypothetical protein K8F30_01115 [Taibaiella sp.]|nr:hypothetical protein [Taibaiella sp.]